MAASNTPSCTAGACSWPSPWSDRVRAGGLRPASRCSRRQPCGDPGHCTHVVPAVPGGVHGIVVRQPATGPIHPVPAARTAHRRFVLRVLAPAACNRHHQFRHPQSGVLACTIRAGQPSGHGGLPRHPGAGHHLAPGLARRMGPTAWRRLHVTGMWIIAAVFTYSYFKRAGQRLVCGAIGTAVHRLRGALDRQAGAGAAPKRACAATAADGLTTGARSLSPGKGI